MANTWFKFKKFKINQGKTAMKVGVDSMLLGSIASYKKPKQIIDIGTGTGILAFMAEQRTGSKVLAIEINKDAYDQCVENISYNKKTEKIIVKHVSFQDFCLDNVMKFDHIVCNPPFFENSTKPISTASSIAKHSDSLNFNTLISGVSQLLTDAGVFSTIIPFECSENFIKIAEFNSLKVFNRIVVYPKENKKANRVILEFSLKNLKPKEDKLCIREQSSNEYTQEYKNLTKDFYLNTPKA